MIGDNIRMGSKCWGEGCQTVQIVVFLPGVVSACGTNRVSRDFKAMSAAHLISSESASDKLDHGSGGCPAAG